MTGVTEAYSLSGINNHGTLPNLTTRRSRSALYREEERLAANSLNRIDDGQASLLGHTSTNTNQQERQKGQHGPAHLHRCSGILPPLLRH